MARATVATNLLGRKVKLPASWAIGQPGLWDPKDGGKNWGEKGDWPKDPVTCEVTTVWVDEGEVWVGLQSEYGGFGQAKLSWTTAA